MPAKFDKSSIPPARMVHETIDHLSTIVSVAQLNLITEDLSLKVQDDLKRIIQTAREAADNLKHLSEHLREED